MKLNIGCGSEKIEGYKSVDLFVEADIKDDVRILATIGDNSIEAVRTFHLLEHLKDSDVPLAVNSIYRVLKKGGTWEVEVPDLIWLLRDFLNSDDEERWGWKIQTIFGLQFNDGEYHKTGFSLPRLISLTEQAGFRILKAEESFSEKYNQGVLDIKAVKE